MAKLWDKGYSLDKLIEQFTVGDDYVLDRELIVADCAGSIAHGLMLSKIGVLTEEEYLKLRDGLNDIIGKAGKFKIPLHMEDVHTAVENHLTKKVGKAGKKIHTGRSRNDQVVLDTRLYAKGFLLAFKETLLTLIGTLRGFADTFKDVPLVGRTHMQVAMPSSVGLWAGAMAESLLDDLELINTAFKLNDQCPLGSAASYGVPIPLDRELVADKLGFDRVQNNVLYANNSRGKIEAIIMQALHQVMLSLSKLAQDLILWSMPEFKYFTLPDELCSGSSIMPQKKNPCGLELVRAKAAVVEGCLTAVTGIIKALPSGYNRDFQATKGPFMAACSTAIQSVAVCTLTIEKLKVNEEICNSAFTPEVFATDRAIELVSEGMAFRDAYKEVGTNLDKLESMDPQEAIKKKTHTGATGNLKLKVIDKALTANRKRLEEEHGHFYGALKELTGLEQVPVYKKPF